MMTNECGMHRVAATECAKLCTALRRAFSCVSAAVRRYGNGGDVFGRRMCNGGAHLDTIDLVEGVQPSRHGKEAGEEGFQGFCESTTRHWKPR